MCKGRQALNANQFSGTRNLNGLADHVLNTVSPRPSRLKFSGGPFLALTNSNQFGALNRLNT